MTDKIPVNDDVR